MVLMRNNAMTKTLKTTRQQIHCITYGCGNAYNPSKFEAIQNKSNKPHGGLWASPIASKYGWCDWCKIEEYGDLSTNFKFVFEGRVYVINDEEDLMRMSFLKTFRHCGYIDFESLVSTVDAILLTIVGQGKTRFSQPGLYGWDCECLLVFNKRCINIQRRRYANM